MLRINLQGARQQNYFKVEDVRIIAKAKQSIKEVVFVVAGVGRESKLEKHGGGRCGGHDVILER